VLVYGHKEPAMLVAMLAAARVGRPYVPADVAVPGARLARMAERARPTACLAARPLPEELAAWLAEAGVACVRLDALGVPAGAVAWAATADASPVPRGTAYVMFTSGTTGEPKGVPIPWSALEHFAEWLLATLQPRPHEEVVLNQAPFSFDLSVMDLCLALRSGGALFSVSHDMVAQPRELFSALAASQLTLWVSTPSFARFCVAEPRFGEAMLPHLRRFVFCGETLPPNLVADLGRRFPRAEVWNTYGPTETTVAVTAVRLDPRGVEDGPLPVGRVAPGMRIAVVDEALRPVPDGTWGEVLIAGPQVSPGYLAAPGEAVPGAERFVTLQATGERAYRTGDRGRWQGDLLYLAGRLDRQVKVRGYRIELDEVAAHLEALPGVAEAAVIAVPPEAPAYLVAFVATAEMPADQAEAFRRGEALREALRTRLPGYAVPRVVRFLPRLPLTARGKVDYRALEALAR
jgi:D-alanine--poly(phosphoribitol) ligase subunit 1